MVRTMDELAERLRDLGAPDPAGWAASEAREGIPQQARFLFLRAMWPDVIDRWSSEDAIRKLPVGARLLDGGASVTDVARLLRGVAYETAFAVVDRVDEGYDPAAPDDAPGWTLIETDREGNATGRIVGGLHEDLLILDPSGVEGADLWR
jgi:hypothetical protein